MIADRIADAWRRIEAWAAREWPDKELKLRPPASAAAIEKAEAAIGVRLPDEFRASLAIHDGQDDEPSLSILPSSDRLGSLESMVACWRDDRTLFAPDEEPYLSDDDRVEHRWHRPEHVAFAGSTFWDYGRLSFDFAPGPAGIVGQIIAGHSDGEPFVVATSFGDLLEGIAAGLESGALIGRAAPHGWVTLCWRTGSAKKPTERPAEAYFRARLG